MLRRIGCWAVVFALTGCTGEEFVAGQGGGPTSATSSGETGATTTATGTGTGTGTGTTTSTGATTSVTTGTGGSECPGQCLGDGVCREGNSLAYCGISGGPCAACEEAADGCFTATCIGGACGTEPAEDGTPCGDGFFGSCQAGTCVIGGENCLNGADDDVDGDTDCADDECPAFDCSDPAGSGWAGPFLVLSGDAEATCPAGLELDTVVYTAPTGDCTCEDPEFGPCTAQVSVGESCELAAIARTYEEGECGPAISISGSFGFYTATTSTTCTAEGVVPSPAATVLTTCIVLGGGCEKSEACLPPVQAPSGSDALLCVRAPPATPSCPPDFPMPRPAWLNPQIDCDCTCSVPGGCVGEIVTSDDSACAGCADPPCPRIDVPVGKPCQDIVGLNGPLYAQLEVSSDGNPSVGEGTAAFTAAQSALYCCQPYPGR